MYKLARVYYSRASSQHCIIGFSSSSTTKIIILDKINMSEIYTADNTILRHQFLPVNVQALRFQNVFPNWFQGKLQAFHSCRDSPRFIFCTSWIIKERVHICHINNSYIFLRGEMRAFPMAYSRLGVTCLFSHLGCEHSFRMSGIEPNGAYSV